jgi:hypothetical protein
LTTSVTIASRADLLRALARILEQLAPDAEASMDEPMTAGNMADVLSDCAYASFTPDEGRAWNAMSFGEKRHVCLDIARRYYD